MSGLTTKTPILTFHDVISKRDGTDLWFDCTAKELDDELTWLSNHGGHFVSLDQVFRHLTIGDPLPKGAIAITFADGYEGFFRFGVPILRRHHVPVTQFVHTDYVGDQHGRPKMTWEQIKELDREGLASFGSQTLTHPADLRRLSATELRRELVNSKKKLEEELGHPVPFLAYPNGKFDLRVARAAELAHYSMAFTEQLMPSEASPNRFMVSRYVHTKFKMAWRDAGNRVR